MSKAIKSSRFPRREPLILDETVQVSQVSPTVTSTREELVPEELVIEEVGGEVENAIQDQAALGSNLAEALNRLRPSNFITYQPSDFVDTLQTFVTRGRTSRSSLAEVDTVKKQKTKHTESFPYSTKHGTVFFNRSLTDMEERFLKSNGPINLCNCARNLVILEQKEEDVNETEECIISYKELANELALKHCSSTIKDFSIENNEGEYNNAYQEFIKIILSFKRYTNE